MVTGKNGADRTYALVRPKMKRQVKRRPIARADAIRVAEALPYDPSCDVCIGILDGDHPASCALRARDRILAVAEVEN